MEEIRILFFATLKDLVGEKQVDVDFTPGLRVGDLKHRLEELFPAIRPALKTVLVSVNHEYAQDGDSIPPGAEVAFFPPVSGGVFPTIVQITQGALDVDDLLAQITLPTTGAACSFVGMVRGITQRNPPHETLYLDYEAYQPMAEAKMRQIAEEIRHRWSAIEGIAIVQRIGRLHPQPHVPGSRPGLERRDDTPGQLVHPRR